MDLGDLAGQIVTGVTQVAVARANAQNRTAPVAGPNLRPAFLEGIPFVGEEVAGVACAIEHKKRRRRRRRLATTTDIRDLAALQVTVGKGNAFNQWIATHPSY